MEEKSLKFTKLWLVVTTIVSVSVWWIVSVGAELKQIQEVMLGTSVHTTQVPSNINLPKLPKVLVIFFPQYHADPLNDKHWGANFTDWNSLKASAPKNRLGYAIPRPTELGYYDLKDEGVREKQGQLARQYGIDGFIYHHYWFYDTSHPGPNLAAPLLRMLEDGKPDIPFFFNWCADRWINVWMGKTIFDEKTPDVSEPVVLQDQFFNATDEMILEHYQWLARFFHHKNYILIDNQPVLMLYKGELYNEEQKKQGPYQILERLRQHAKDDGFDGLYIIVGRRAAPLHIYEPPSQKQNRVRNEQRNSDSRLPMDMGIFNQSMTYPFPLEYVVHEYEVPSWCKNGKKREEQHPESRQEATGLLTSFDNTPRREFDTSHIFSADTPENNMKKFRANLHATMTYYICCQQQTNDRIVAINAWNEWAEGMAVEPSDVYGRGFLETIRDVKAQVQKEGCSSVVKRAT